jgi:serine/threonine-protein kinase
MDPFFTSLQSLLGARYHLLDEVARGGMARVYRAEDLEGGGEVAVKVVRPELAAALGTGRFLREIEILGRLRHPNILPMLYSRHENGRLYYVTPFVPGGSLQRRIAREAAFPLGEILRISHDVAAALDYAHRHEVIHRDVKPGNVLLAEDRAVVCDFGVARAVELAASDRFTSSSGFAVGTPAYMSPEQAIGSVVDARSDVYGLGCVMYEMLTGEPPFTGATAQAVLARSLAGECRPIRSVRADVSPSAEAAIRSALAPEPHARPASASELVHDFARALQSDLS